MLGLLPFFFYGMLMDGDVLSAVAGRRIAERSRRPAILGGYRRVYCAGESYPILVPAADERVAGVLVSGLGRAETERLIAFEAEDYDLIEITVEAARIGATTAQMFQVRAGVPASLRAWSPDEWRRRHKAVELLRLRGSRS